MRRRCAASQFVERDRDASDRPATLEMDDRTEEVKMELVDIIVECFVQLLISKYARKGEWIMIDLRNDRKACSQSGGCS